jgi:hypothetical protein
VLTRVHLCAVAVSSLVIVSCSDDKMPGTDIKPYAIPATEPAPYPEVENAAPLNNVERDAGLEGQDVDGGSRMPGVPPMPPRNYDAPVRAPDAGYPPQHQR